MWTQDLRIKHLGVYGHNDSLYGGRNAAASPASPTSTTVDPSVSQFGFELIIAKTRKRAQSSVVFACEDESATLSW